MLAAILGACGSDDAQEADAHLERAAEFAEKGDHRATVIELKNALQKNPELARARWLLGKTYVALGLGANASKELEKARELGDKTAELPLLLARAYLLQGEFKKALALAEETAPGETHHDWLIARANAQLGLDRPLVAKTLLEKALELQPDSQPARRGLARVDLTEGKASEAKAHVDRALEGGAADVETLILKGELELSLKNFDDAREAFQRALTLSANSVAAKLGLARTHLARQKPDEASKYVEELAAIGPKDPRVNFLKALMARQKNDLKSAKQSLREVLSVVPEHAQSLLLMGQINYLQRDFEQADTMLGRYVAHLPSALGARKLLAAVQIELRQPDKAIETLRVVEQRTPEDPQMLAMMGTAYMNQRDFEKGKAYLDRAAKIAPEAAPIRTQLAVTHLATGSPEAAVSELEAAVESDPSFARADFLLILTLLQNRNFDKALASAQKLLAKQPKSAQAYNLVAAAYEGKQDTGQARANYAKALELDAEFHAAALNIARLDLRDGKVEQARKGYESILEKDAHNALALVALAKIASDDGRAQEGVALLERAREKNPKALQPRLILTAYYLRQAKPKEALAIAEEANSVAADNPAQRLLLGRALLANGETDKASTLLQGLIESFPDSPDSHYQLALAYAQKRRYSKAQASLERVLVLRPDNLIAKATLGNVLLRDGETDRAVTIARELQGAFSKVPAGYLLEGDALLGQGKAAEAVPVYEKALATLRNATTVIKLHAALRTAGREDEARALLNAWIGEQPDDAAIRLVRASQSHQTGDKNEAVADYEKVLAKQPNSVLALNNLAWLYYERQDPRALDLAARAYKLVPGRAEIIDTYGWLLLQQGQIQQGLVLIEKAAKRAPGNGDIRYHHAAALAKSGETAEAKSVLQALLDEGKAFAEKGAAEALLKELP